MSEGIGYPVHVEGQRDAGLSRWLWLVKWLLAIPHYIVLAFLWIAFFVLTFVALVAILVTARYPRSLFDFNVGVLRWTWRVGFYTYGALGTDRYPPFTLGDAPDYPARLQVAHPNDLSRGLVLVKWWLLAIPQYAIVSIFVGGGGWFNRASSGIGLIDLLVLVAGVALLFTGRYPAGIFDLVVGLNRWALRVAAYAGLMTDRYPPFRLDQGSMEPSGSERVAPVEPAAPVAHRYTGGRIVLIVLGGLMALIAFGLAAGGLTMLVLDHTQRDRDGYLMTPHRHLSTGTYAITSGAIDLGRGGSARDFLGSVRIHTDSERPVFVGIARARTTDRYLAGVGRAEVKDVSPWNVSYQVTGGGPPAARPEAQTFWVASATGSGGQNLTWKPSSGTWRVVVMNDDGSRMVDVDASVGAKLDSWAWIYGSLLVGALVLAFAAAGVIHLALRRTPPTA